MSHQHRHSANLGTYSQTAAALANDEMGAKVTSHVSGRTWEPSIHSVYIDAGHPPRGSASATFNEDSCLTHASSRKKRIHVSQTIPETTRVTPRLIGSEGGLHIVQIRYLLYTG
jgi:hypothetical protein